MSPDQGLLGLDAQPCRECGAPIPYFGRGRRRRVCDSCRPGWWPEVVREPTNIRRSQSGATGAPHARHRRTDPPTSREAAESVPPTAVETRILEAFALFGWLTDAELVEVVEGYPPTIKTARSRLTKRGVLVDTGTTRLSPRGRACTVWKRAEAES